MKNNGFLIIKYLWFVNFKCISKKIIEFRKYSSVNWFTPFYVLIRPDVIWKKKYHVHCITSISPWCTPIHGINAYIKSGSWFHCRRPMCRRSWSNHPLRPIGCYASNIVITSHLAHDVIAHETASTARSKWTSMPQQEVIKLHNCSN